MNLRAAMLPQALAVVVSQWPRVWRMPTPIIILPESFCQPGRPSVAMTALIAASSPEDISHQA